MPLSSETIARKRATNKALRRPGANNWASEPVSSVIASWISFISLSATVRPPTFARIRIASPARPTFVSQRGVSGIAKHRTVKPTEVDIQGAVEEARAGAAGAVFLDGLGGGFFDFRVGNQVEVVVRPEHEDFALADADFAGAAAFAIAEHFEIHVQSSMLQITRTSEIAAFLENVVRCAALLFAGDVASR